MSADSAPLLVDVVILARNAAGTLKGVIERIPPRRARSVVVADRDSDDATLQIARDAGAIVVRGKQQGLGAAGIAAVKHLSTLPKPPEAVVFLAGDGSDDPAELDALLAPLSRGGAELCLGIREARGRRVAAAKNRIALGLIGAIYRHQFEDLSTFRAVRFPALVALGLRDRGAGWIVEMQVRALRLGLRIVEVPVSYHQPGGGDREGPGRSIRSAGRVLFQILRHATAR